MEAENDVLSFTVAVSMVINKRTQIICTLFHDFADVRMLVYVAIECL